MGNVVPMDSKLLSNYWYMSWQSWPTHISKLCSHKDDNFVMRFIRHCTESDSHKSRCGWTLKKNYRSPSGFETIRITNVQTDAITNFFRQQQRNLSSFRGRFCGFTTIRWTAPYHGSHWNAMFGFNSLDYTPCTSRWSCYPDRCHPSQQGNMFYFYC